MIEKDGLSWGTITQLFVVEDWWTGLAYLYDF